MTRVTRNPTPDPDPAAPTTAPPQLPVSLLYRLYERDEGGPDLTDGERKRWDSYVTESEEFERRRDLLGLVDLADVMENGVTEPEMLTESLVRGEHHVVFGARESAKTWLVLADAAALIRTGESVVWVDKEMGRRNIAGRLLTLGATPDQARADFVYMEFPSMDCGSESKAAWRALLGEREPALVVVDAQTEVLADAGLNENSGTDVEKWSQAYVTPARRLGAATVMIDHTGHSEKGRPVASRQKGAAAKVELSVTKDAPFRRDKVGGFTVEVTKNTVSAPIPRQRSWRIGGEDGKFVFAPSEPQADPAALKGAERRAKIEADILTVLRKHRESWPLTQKQVCDMVEGRKGEVSDALRRLALSELSPVKQAPGARGSLQYSLSDAD